MPGAQRTDNAREEAFYRAHGEKREMHNVVRNTVLYADDNVSQKRAEIDMGENESDAGDIFIKMFARMRE
jgi:hypothetical protein